MDALKRISMLLAISVATAVVLVPLASVTTLPLQDLPNHVARASIIANIESSSLLRKYYEISWGGVTNLATEAVLLPLGHVLHWEIASKILVGVALLFIPAGVFFLNWAIFGRISVHTLLVYLFVYNESLIRGFTSYLISVGLFLFLFALWIRTVRWLPVARITAFSILATLLMFSHLYGLGLYGLTVMAYETGIVILTWRAERRVLFKPWLRAAAQFALPLGVFVAVSSTADQAGSTSWSQLSDKWHYYQKIFLLKELMPNHAPDPTDSTNIVLFLIVIACAALGFLARRVEFDRRLILPVIALLVVFVMLPKNLFSGLNVDDRLPIAIAAILLASTRLRVDRAALGAVVAVGVLGILAFQVTMITRHWREYDRYYDEYLSAFQELPQGARLAAAIGYVGPADSLRTPPLMHLGNVVVTTREGFFTTIFSHPGQQPIRLSPQYADVQKRYPAVDYRNQQLANEYLERIRPLFDPEVLSSYDYFLWVRPHLFDVQPPSVFEPIFHGSDFVLYRIVREPGRQGDPPRLP